MAGCTNLARCLPERLGPTRLARIVPAVCQTAAGAPKYIREQEKTHFRWNNLRHFERQNLNVCNKGALVSKVGAQKQQRARVITTDKLLMHAH